MGELCLVLAVVKAGRWKKSRRHSYRHNAGGVSGVTCRALRSHQVGDGARGAKGSRSSVSVQMRLAGKVGSCQVRVYCPMAGAIVRERIRGLGKRRCYVGLLSPMAGRTLGVHVLRYLQ